MTETTVAVITVLVLAWSVVSGLLLRVNVTGALVFTVAGYLLANPSWGVLTVDVDTPSIHLLAEATLALLLFSDAARVDVLRLRKDVAVPARLLGIGLPLTLLLGAVVAAWCFQDLSLALVCFIAATLAPTDAALSAQVINDEQVPMRLRRALNVESGLNDGIVTPVVAFTLAVAATELGVHGAGSSGQGEALRELAVGLGVGLAVGLASGFLIALGSRRRWIITGGRRLASLAAALSSFALAVSLDGNGFIAAFVGGIAFGAQVQKEAAEVEVAVELPELLGEILALVVWFLFGAVLVPVVIEHSGLLTVVYALLSLTVLRMLPVSLALIGTGLDRRTVLFVGWFGPRGLASVVFALLAVEELGETLLVAQAIAVVCLTVLLSVVLHGVSAGPLGRRYVRLEKADQMGVPEAPDEPPMARGAGHTGRERR
jgi:NhaP-type Na+/H+ or K+/H+ antiporter